MREGKIDGENRGKWGLWGEGEEGIVGTKEKGSSYLLNRKKGVFHRCEMMLRSPFWTPVGADGAIRRGRGLCTFGKMAHAKSAKSAKGSGHGRRA